MKTQKAKRLVLGEGETIGHKHVLESNTNIEYERLKDSIRIVLSEAGILTHDEHDLMVFPAGKYRSYHQVEFNPMDNSINRVFD